MAEVEVMFCFSVVGFGPLKGTFLEWEGESERERERQREREREKEKERDVCICST